MLVSVGANFAANNSLSSRYTSYLTSSSHGLTATSVFLHSDPSSVFVATSKASNRQTLDLDEGQEDPLIVLGALSRRHGFQRCSGRLFATEYLSRGINNFYKDIKQRLPNNVVIRTHVHPQEFTKEILDYIDADADCCQRNIICSPTNFSLVLVAVRMSRDGDEDSDDLIGWGLYSLDQYKSVISRPGDGDRLPTFDLNFNRAELKLAEALQHLSPAVSEGLFSQPLLALDVGASPGGWTRVLATSKVPPRSPKDPTLDPGHVSVLAIDPGQLSESVASLSRVRHLACKAEAVSDNGGRLLQEEAERLVGEAWEQQLRLLVCDANLDIRDTLRELVLPLAKFLPNKGLLIVTLKLGRRVGVDGVKRKEAAARELLIGAGFDPVSIKVEWLFGNSKNERTIFATKL